MINVKSEISVALIERKNNTHAKKMMMKKKDMVAFPN